jgi:predicted nicotinamide N-methyase
VVDAGAGGGLASIAAAKAGAASVTAVDPDPEAVAAIARNAAENQVNLNVVRGDAFDGTLSVDAGDLLIAGDMFYTGAMADRVMPVLRRAERAGARVLVGDPGRGFLPEARFASRARYDVPTRTVVEGAAIRQTTVWELITTGEKT